MTAPLKHTLAPALVQAMGQLSRVGYQLVPLGGGGDGKAPLCALKGVLHPLRQVIALMSRHASRMYGIRLSSLVVLDVDLNEPSLIDDLEARFGPAAVHVQTSRGRHLWYRAPGGPLPSLAGEGLPVDVKSGNNAYVVGPGSVRPDGGRYIPIKGDLATDRLSVLHLPAQASSRAPLPRLSLAALDGAKVPEGQRHHTLIKEAVAAVRYLQSLEELTMHLRVIVSRDFANPTTMPDNEIAGAAEWAWDLRLNNSLWGPDQSTFRMSREARGILKGKPHARDAWWLLSTLVEAHGHTPGKRFVLDREAMKSTGLDLSERAFLQARKLLEAEGLLHRAKGHRAGHSRAQWQLGRAAPALEMPVTSTNTTPIDERQ